MNLYQPADDRAEETLKYLLATLWSALQAAQTQRDVGGMLSAALPFGLAHNTELQLRLEFPFGTEIEKLRTGAYTFAYKAIANSIAKDLPAILVLRNHIHYFTREDVIRWMRNSPIYKDVYVPPEIITISVTGFPNSSQMELNEDQMNGLAFAIEGTEQARRPILMSSVTERPVDTAAIVAHSPIYVIEPPLATDKLRRPYRIDIRQADRTFKTIYFDDPDFMQGVLSVISWQSPPLPNNGKGSLWENLQEFTRDGYVNLTF